MDVNIRTLVSGTVHVEIKDVGQSDVTLPEQALGYFAAQAYALIDGKNIGPAMDEVFELLWFSVAERKAIFRMKEGIVV